MVPVCRKSATRLPGGRCVGRTGLGAEWLGRIRCRVGSAALGVMLISAGAPHGTCAADPPVISLVHVLAEAEQAFAAQHPADAAPALDRAIERVEKGEVLPQGVSLGRLQLAAATAHFHAGNLSRVESLARAAAASGALPATAQAEARLLLGLVLARTERYAEAAAVFATLENTAHRDLARRYHAMAARAAGNAAEAITAFQAYLGGAPRDHLWGEAALALISLHVEQGNLERANRGLAMLRGSFHLVDNLAGLEVLSLQLGDAWLRAGDADAALDAYDVVSPRGELVAAQRARNARLGRELERAQRAPASDVSSANDARDIEARLEAARAALESIELQEDYDASLLFRRAQAFARADRPWEAALVFERLLQDHPGFANVEIAYHALVCAYVDANRGARADDALRRFCAASGATERVIEAAARVVGAEPDPKRQIVMLEQLRAEFGDAPAAEPLILLHANALFVAGRHDDVRVLASNHTRRFPRGHVREQMSYLAAVAALAAGEPRQAVVEFTDFVKAHPQSRFLADVRYRLATATFGAGEPDAADDLCRAWLDEFSTAHPQAGEVLALAGDIAAAGGRVDEAVHAYRDALDHPLPDELLGYVLDEVTGLLERKNDRAGAIRIWKEFATSHPDHPFVVHAAYWIGRLQSREGRTADALPAIAAIVGRFMDDVRHDGVERLLAELPALVVRAAKQRARESGDAAPNLEQIGRQLDVLLQGDGGTSSTADARRLFAQAELAALMNEPTEGSARWDEIALFRNDVLPPGILGRAGDHLYSCEKYARAAEVYAHLVAAHPGSVFADFGFTGLGNLALRDGRAADALKHFEDAVDKAGAHFKLLEATLGRARALMALGRWEEAREVFQGIASNRQWRGAATAESVFSLGEILYRQGGRANLAQAQAHFQRVYLSYRKYQTWAVRAYLRSADALDQLGQQADAAATLRELLRDAELRAHPESLAATTKLAAIEAANTARQREGES